MDPTQPPLQTPPEIIIPQSKPNYLKTIIFSVLGDSVFNYIFKNE